MVSLFPELAPVAQTHQNQPPPEANKFHVANGGDGKHYWLTPPDLYAKLDAEFHFDFDPCPYPLPDGFDGLTCEWGQSSYSNSRRCNDPSATTIRRFGRWLEIAVVGAWLRPHRVRLVRMIASSPPLAGSPEEMAS